MQLEEIIEYSYSLFEKYTIGSTLGVCKRCCVSDADEAILINTPLREISSSDLRVGYFASARSYSYQELLEMKYFLPRVLELVSNFDFPSVSVEEVFLRLTLNSPECWTNDELQLLSDFSVEFFKKCLSFYPYSPDGDDLSSYLTMFAVSDFQLKPILDAWTNAENIESTLQFKDFFLYRIDYQAPASFKFLSDFSQSTNNEVFTKWLTDNSVKSRFSVKIDKILAENKNLDTDEIQELSLVKELLSM